MCHDSRDPFLVRVPDDLDPEHAEILIDFLETVLESLHRNYDYSILQRHHELEQDCRDSRIDARTPGHDPYF